MKKILLAVSPFVMVQTLRLYDNDKLLNEYISPLDQLLETIQYLIDTYSVKEIVLKGEPYSSHYAKLIKNVNPHVKIRLF